jgi:hypothetical protein
VRSILLLCTLLLPWPVVQAQKIPKADDEAFTVGFVKTVLAEAKGTQEYDMVEALLQAYMQGAVDSTYLMYFFLRANELGIDMENMSQREERLLTDDTSCALALSAEQIMYLVLATTADRDEDLVSTFTMEQALDRCDE